jgi:glycerate kinase
MTSTEICGIMKEVIHSHFPECVVRSVPVADGGEGSVDCFLHSMGGVKVPERVSGPFFHEMEAFYGIVDDGKTAVVEMAACAGLPLVGDSGNPMVTTTYGVGQLIRSAVERGCEKIVLGLGGSCTNDAGCGAAAALGVKFLDKNGTEFVPVGGTLKDIAEMDVSQLHPGLRKTELVCMCDIDNPLYGENGAAYVFSPQKGAGPEEVLLLDEGLRSFAELVRRSLGTDPGTIAGGGAAGGMGAGMAVLLNAELKMGIQAVLDMVRFDSMIQGSDLIFTGEGKIDRQSLRGKVVIGVARRAKIQRIPVVAVVGDIGENIEKAYDEGVTAIFSINNVAVPFEKARLRCKEDMAMTMENIVRLLSCRAANLNG